MLRNKIVLFGLFFQLLISMVKAIQIYYLPFYFQSVLGRSAIFSGILTLPYLMTLLVSPMVSGVIISRHGHYMAVMYIGSSLSCAGSAILTTLNPNSTSSHYIGYQFVAALGAGIVQQVQLTAVPLALPVSDMATASAVVSFFNNLGPVIILSLGNILFTNELELKLAQIPGLDKGLVGSGINGAVNLSKLVPSKFLSSVREALGFGLGRTLLLAVPSAGLALLFCFGIHCLRLKDRSLD